jgi:hypothetical protein
MAVTLRLMARDYAKHLQAGTGKNLHTTERPPRRFTGGSPAHVLDSRSIVPGAPMALKLSSRQQAQLAYLQLLPPKFQRIYSVVEQLALPRVDETLMRVLGRLVDDIKGNAASLSLGPLAETAGRMGMVVRGGGGMPAKVRNLRELQNSLKINYDAALRTATTPGALDDEAPSAADPAV